MSELDLTGAHVAQLGDEDLRLLVVKLCEAELRRTGHPSSAVMAGGSQTAADGGVDVRVQIDSVASAPSSIGFSSEPGLPNPRLDFIPRASTGFQVKCEDMPAGKVANEMRPDGVLRNAIKELIASKGAYVIVSSKGTLADKSLANRLTAMRESVDDEPGHKDLKLDFYDRDRLARWTRQYPGVEMWLRERVNARLQSWQGFGAWAGSEGVGYLLDDTARLLERAAGAATTALSVKDGLGRLREALRKPGQVVRLIGLSGTGMRLPLRNGVHSRVVRRQSCAAPPTSVARIASGFGTQVTNVAANGCRSQSIP